MGGHELDLSRACTWEDGLPRPQWDLIETWIESRCAPDDRPDAWTEVGRQWTDELAAALGPDYQTGESEHFLMVAHAAGRYGPTLLAFAEECRRTLLSVLAGVADFGIPGKQLVLAFRSADDYYRYVAHFDAEGEHGASGGCHIRDGYPHVALHGKQLGMQDRTLAHELTHVALHHLSMPQWLEEGLAQMFENDMTRRPLLLLDATLARRHKEYWREHGLEEFWHGAGFHSADEVQELSYQLAEILVRLLVEDARPRWFGWVREPQRRFAAFLRAASVEDGGEAACREHLGCGVGDLAAQFLGPGEWAPGY